jgi:hypothetical protein
MEISKDRAPPFRGIFLGSKVGTIQTLISVNLKYFLPIV